MEAVLLREGDLPYTFVGMVPAHLAVQLLSMEEGKREKKQRNTQAELLAVLMAILMWFEDLEGQSLLMLTDSTALNNYKEGTAADQQRRDLVSTILCLGGRYRIHIWFDWVPSQQNPGDPYSRPNTGKKERAELDAKMNAILFAPARPSFIRAGPAVWRTVLQSKDAPKTWSISKQVEMLVELGVARLEEFALSLLHIINPDKVRVLRLGHWRRYKQTQGSPHTLFSLQCTKLVINLAGAPAPGHLSHPS